MRRSVVTGLVLVAAMVWPASPAGAGGWWSSIQVDGGVLAVGEEATVTAQVGFRGIDEAGTAQAGEPSFHAYLLRGVDRDALDDAMRTGEPGDWWEPPAEAVRLGPVTFEQWDRNLLRAVARFRVPDVAPGSYDLMLCTDGCAEPLADVIPTLDVVVSRDPVLARLAREVAEARHGFWDGVSRLQSGIDGISAAQEGLSRRLGNVEVTAKKALAAATADGSDEASGDPVEPAVASAAGGWLTATGWFLAGVLATLLVRRRAPDPGPGREVDDLPVESWDRGDELPPPELVTGPPVPVGRSDPRG